MEKKIALCATKKINILTLVSSEKKILNETKNHNPPFKLNGRSLISAVKTGLQSYCDTSYSRGGVNQMWILKNSKDLLEYIQSSPSPPAIALKHLTSLPSTQRFLTLS